MQTVGWGGEEALHVNSSEGMTFDCSVSVNYDISPKAAPALYSKFRKGLGDIEQGYMKNLVKELLRREFQRYPADKLVAEKQSEIRGAVEKGLREDLEKDGINIKNFIISNAKAPQAVIDAITQRVKATQYGQQVENEIRATEADSKKKVALANGEALAAITRAEADFKVKKLKADAEKYYINSVTQSLTPAFVEYTRAQKWDGKLPTVTSGNTPFLDLRK
jgi:regulator of protease activity HflC (stomatin/prohibitin superfamily)